VLQGGRKQNVTEVTTGYIRAGMGSFPGLNTHNFAIVESKGWKWRES